MIQSTTACTCVVCLISAVYKPDVTHCMLVYPSKSYDETDCKSEIYGINNLTSQAIFRKFNQKIDCLAFPLDFSF